VVILNRDGSGAAGEDEMRAALGLHGQTTGKGTVPRKDLHSRPIELFMCTVKGKQGYGEGRCFIIVVCLSHTGFRWLAQYL
jgi:GTP-binding protein SAR1